MTMTATEDCTGDHLCLNGNRCSNKVDGHARETEEANAFCPSCLRKSERNVKQLPEQYGFLYALIGERQAGIDVNIKRAKPSGSVLINLHIDTLMGNIVTDITSAAEVVAEKMAMRDEHDDPWDATRSTPAEQVQACARILSPNLRVIATARGVGGREASDPNIDVMKWLPGGMAFEPSTTTGIEMIKRLDHLASLAFFTLGQTRARTKRPLPCNRCHSYSVGRWAGSEYYDCQGCGAHFQEDDLRRQDKVLLELWRRGLIEAPARKT